MKAKFEECGPGGEKCPPPAPVHSVHFVDMETDYKPTNPDDSGMLMFTCNKADEFPNACSGSFNITLEWSLVSDPGNYAQKGTAHYGMGLYAFSTYDAEAGVTRPVLQMRLSMGEVDGICGTEYKVNATDSCFGLKGKDVPVVDPPEPPSLNGLVKPPLPALHATPVPGMGAGGVIVIVLLVLVVLGGLGAGAFYMKRKKEEEQRALRTTQEVELNWSSRTCKITHTIIPCLYNRCVDVWVDFLSAIWLVLTVRCEGDIWWWFNIFYHLGPQWSERQLKIKSSGIDSLSNLGCKCTFLQRPVWKGSQLPQCARECLCNFGVAQIGDMVYTGVSDCESHDDSNLVKLSLSQNRYLACSAAGISRILGM